MLNQPFKINRRFGGGHHDWDHPAPGYNKKEWRRFALFWVYFPYVWGCGGGCWLVYTLYAMRDEHV